MTVPLLHFLLFLISKDVKKSLYINSLNNHLGTAPDFCVALYSFHSAFMCSDLLGGGGGG